jgi:uncharacterized membrane protein YraQ (UPF0718 family)
LLSKGSIDVQTDQIVQFTKMFTSILYEAMPFIVLGAVISGLLEELVPQQLVARLIPRSRVLAIAIGGLLGVLFPMCECGIIPVMRRLLRKGVPLSCCVCYMLAGPIINVVVMVSTYVAFSGMEKMAPTAEQPLRQYGGLEMMLLRMGLGYLVAFGTSLVVEWQYRKHGDKLLNPMAVPDKALPLVDEDNGGARRSWFQRLGTIAETSLHDFVDITVYLIIGAILASASRLVLNQEQVQALASNPSLCILIMMGMAILLCICSEADAFVAASFRMLPPASKLAFLVLGPMLDFKLYMMYTRVFRPRLIWTIITCVVIQVFIYSHFVHWLHLENLQPQSLLPEATGP